MSVLERLTVGWVHSFRTEGGNIGYFPGLPTHSSKENCELCRSPEMVVEMLGLIDNGPMEVKVLKEAPDVVLHAGIPVMEMPTPIGYFILTGGPNFEKAKARIVEEGGHIHDANNEADVQKALEDYEARSAMAPDNDNEVAEDTEALISRIFGSAKAGHA